MLVKVHSKAIGDDPVTGGRYDANSPDSQLWIHVTAWHSILYCYEKFGPGRLSEADELQYWDECARAAQLHPGAMTRLLDKLEAQGWVGRVTDPQDRRALHIDLTPDGRRRWEAVSDCGRRVHARAMQGLDDAEQARLMDLLGRVRENLLSDTD